jgi:purine-binding chemotaxis protein CheW
MNENNASNNVYFTFVLGDVAYAIDVQSVKEVLTYEAITPVPRTVNYMKGVMNIRGTVISVIDFRVLFNIPVKENEKSTSIVVTEVSSQNEAPLTFGFIADSVEGVNALDAEIDKSNIDSGLSAINNDFIRSLGRLGDRFVLILDTPKILESVEKDLNTKSKTK